MQRAILNLFKGEDMETEFPIKTSRDPLSADFIEDSEVRPRSKTSLRMVYEAQVSVIQKQIGDLEKIRTDLGLSQRKMCQLLMVDPSAWTRWTRQEQPIPPHIWRALQWYLTLQEKIPGLTPQYFIGKDPQILLEKTRAEMAELKTDFFKRSSQLHQEMQKELRFYRRILYFMTGTTILMAGALLLVFTQG